MTGKPELLPCPFCGDKAGVNREHCLDGSGIFLTVKCGKCRAKSGEKYHTHGNDCPQTYQEVRDLWNTRARPMTVAEAAKVLLDDPAACRELCGGAEFVRFRLRALSEGGE